MFFIIFFLKKKTDESKNIEGWSEISRKKKGVMTLIETGSSSKVSIESLV